VNYKDRPSSFVQFGEQFNLVRSFTNDTTLICIYNLKVISQKKKKFVGNYKIVGRFAINIM